MTHAEEYLTGLLTTHGDVREQYTQAQARRRGITPGDLAAARAHLGIWTYVQYGSVYWSIRERISHETSLPTYPAGDPAHDYCQRAHLGLAIGCGCL